MQDRNASNAIVREYAWGLNAGGGIGGLLNMRSAGQNYNYLYDGKGNVGAVVDSAQSVVASYRYDAFGRLMTKSGTLDQPFQFSTKRYLADVGLNYYGYRFYSPSIGRWVNRDPLGEMGGINLYGFVQNNPFNLFDPWGLEDLGQQIGNQVQWWVDNSSIEEVLNDPYHPINWEKILIWDLLIQWLNEDYEACKPWNHETHD
jgi:RHS repeat-associated protein